MSPPRALLPLPPNSTHMAGLRGNSWSPENELDAMEKTIIWVKEARIPESSCPENLLLLRSRVSKASMCASSLQGTCPQKLFESKCKFAIVRTLESVLGMGPDSELLAKFRNPRRLNAEMSAPSVPVIMFELRSTSCSSVTR